MACIDEDDLENWPEFFTLDACRYEIIARENVERGKPLALMFCTSRSMLVTRHESFESFMYSCRRGMDKEDARKQSREVLQERRKQVVRLHRRGIGARLRSPLTNSTRSAPRFITPMPLRCIRITCFRLSCRTARVCVCASSLSICGGQFHRP